MKRGQRDWIEFREERVLYELGDCVCFVRVGDAINLYTQYAFMSCHFHLAI